MTTKIYTTIEDFIAESLMSQALQMLGHAKQQYAGHFQPHISGGEFDLVNGKAYAPNPSTIEVEYEIRTDGNPEVDGKSVVIKYSSNDEGTRVDKTFEADDPAVRAWFTPSRGDGPARFAAATERADDLRHAIEHVFDNAGVLQEAFAGLRFADEAQRAMQAVNEWGTALKPYLGFYRKELVSDTFDIYVDKAYYDPKSKDITIDCELSTLDGELKGVPFGITISKGVITANPCPECTAYMEAHPGAQDELDALVKAVNRRPVAAASVAESLNAAPLAAVAAAAEDELAGMKTFPPQHFVGLVDVVMNRTGKQGLPDPETVDACKQAVCDQFYGGAEPEFNTDELVEWWGNLSPASFERNLKYLRWAMDAEPK